ncbi:MAG: TonB-dependent receptor plug domain-containing protein, partial [Limisphaerales bacterium]
VKGGASALYGPNAVAGVVNIIPRDPTHTHATLDFNYNWMDGSASGDQPNTDANGVFEWSNQSGTVGFTAYGMQSFVQGLDVNDDDFTEVTRRDLYGGGLRAVFKPTPEIKLSLDYLHTNEDRRGGEDDEALDITDNEAFTSEHLESTRDVGSILFKHSPSEAFDYQFGFSAANTSRDSYYGGIGSLGYAPIGNPNHNPTVPARLAARFPRYAPALADPAGVFYNPDWTPELGYGETENLLTMTDLSANNYFGERHTLTYGFQFRYETVEDDSGLGRTVNDEYENYGGFLQHDWKLFDPLEVIYGLRVDKHSKVEDLIASPRAALKWTPSKNFDLRASVATGFRAPEVFDEDLHTANVGGDLEVVTLSPALTEEKSLTFSLGPNWRFTPNWEVEGNLFFTQISDVFFNDPSTDDPSTPGIIESTKINSGDASVYGVELNLIYRDGPFTAELGYVEQRSRYGEPQLALGTPGDPLDNPVYVRDFERTPNRYGVLKFSFDTGIWSVFCAGKLTGPMEAPHVVSDEVSGDQIGNVLEETPYFFAVDLGGSYSWRFKGHTKLTAQAGVKNLFNEFQDDLDSGPFRDSAYVYGPRFPRTIYAGFKFEF